MDKENLSQQKKIYRVMRDATTGDIHIEKLSIAYINDTYTYYIPCTGKLLKSIRTEEVYQTYTEIIEKLRSDETNVAFHKGAECFFWEMPDEVREEVKHFNSVQLKFQKAEKINRLTRELNSLKTRIKAEQNKCLEIEADLAALRVDMTE